MSRFLLGMVLACLITAPALADGFEMPRLPDFTFAFPPTPHAGVDARMKTASVATVHRPVARKQATAIPQKQSTAVTQIAQD